jgi:two-component system response regulator
MTITVQPPGMRVLNVLLIEDSQMDINLVRTALARSDRHTSLTAIENGEEALAYLWQCVDNGHMPDVMILDLNLVGLDGWDILKECKASPYLKSVPIVVFTSTAMFEEIRFCYDLGADLVVSKPADLQGFLGAVQEIETWARKRLQLG